MALVKKDIDKWEYRGKKGSNPPSGTDLRWDTDDAGKQNLAGFGLRIYPSGKKTFVIKYRVRVTGKAKRMSIGQYGKWTVQQARDEARELFVRIDKGEDPAAPLTANESITLAEFAPQFLDHMRAHDRKSVNEMERRIYRWFVYDPVLSPHYCPACGKEQKQTLGECSKKGCDGKTRFGSRRRTVLKTKPSLGTKVLREITPAMVENLKGRIGKSARYEANRTITLLKTIFSKSHRLVDGMRGHDNPCTGVEFYEETGRTRYLQELELARLIVALKDEPEWLQSLILFYLHSGLRKNELLSLPWSAVHLNSPEGAYLDVEQTKGKRKLKLALTQSMIDILTSIPRISEKWVFPSPSKPNEHREAFRSHWDRIREKADLVDITIHDLRRTTGTLMASAGVSLHQIGEVLNHSNPAVTKVYARLTRDSQREALETVSNVLSDKLGELRLEA